MSYASQKAWRKRHPEQRARERKRYYTKHRENPQNKTNAGQEWTLREIDCITAKDRLCDTVLGILMGRSVEAIQIARCKLKKRVNG